LLRVPAVVREEVDAATDAAASSTDVINALASSRGRLTAAR
jgi:hypothetical protein